LTRRIDELDVVAFDADDTLWRSEDDFVAAEDRFVHLLEPYVSDGVDLRAALRATERADLPVTGYGVKAFTLSMIQAAVTVSDGRVPSSVIGELTAVGREMLLAPVHLLDGVPDVLQAVSSEVRTVLVTKGDLVHQTRKVTTSGIDHHFSHIEIVLEKDIDTYRAVLDRIGVPAHRFCMIGNSVRSDVLPVLALGGHAVHVPYHVTWAVEVVDDPGRDVTTLASLRDVVVWLGLGPLDGQSRRS
jgi:putative hydrolase of the HAD superfamily